MKEQWKRNAVVATVLLFVCAAVYLNWRYAGDVGKDSAPAGSQNLSAAQEQKDGAAGKDGVTTKVSICPGRRGSGRRRAHRC